MLSRKHVAFKIPDRVFQRMVRMVEERQKAGHQRARLSDLVREAVLEKYLGPKSPTLDLENPTLDFPAAAPTIGTPAPIVKVDAPIVKTPNTPTIRGSVPTIGGIAEPAPTIRAEQSTTAPIIGGSVPAFLVIRDAEYWSAVFERLQSLESEQASLEFAGLTEGMRFPPGFTRLPVDRQIAWLAAKTAS